MPPSFQQANITANEIHHSIVAKKGIKLKYRKSKSKKHSLFRPEKYKKKKHQYVQNDAPVDNEVATDGPYDGGTYMQVKYLDGNEINWGDTTSYPSFSGKDSFIHIDDEETIKR